MKYGQQYFKNRKTVAELTQSITDNCITLKGAKVCGFSGSKIKKW